MSNTDNLIFKRYQDPKDGRFSMIYPECSCSDVPLSWDELVLVFGSRHITSSYFKQLDEGEEFNSQKCQNCKSDYGRKQLNCNHFVCLNCLDPGCCQSCELRLSYYPTIKELQEIEYKKQQMALQLKQKQEREQFEYKEECNCMMTQ